MKIRKKRKPSAAPERSRGAARWVRALLAWFEEHRRPMPWRAEPTAYAVWVSEIMLQQTQVATVMPHFARFVQRFPDVATLAAAPLEVVLKHWEGLGYYARARHLHRAAQDVMRERGGRLPADAAGWRELPGIGPYAAAAIASIAHGEAVPAVDGNVLRVMARFRGSPADIARPATRQLVYDDLAPHIRRVNPSAFNQALMELGALVCRPRQPRCAACPLAPECVARRAGLTGSLPVKTRLRPGPHHVEVAAILRRGSRLLLGCRPARGLLGGLWEFPTARARPDATPARTFAARIGAVTGLTVVPGAELAVVPHAFSHFRVTVHAIEGQVRGGRLRTGAYTALRWVTPAAASDLPLTTVARRLLAAAAGR